MGTSQTKLLAKEYNSLSSLTLSTDKKIRQMTDILSKALSIYINRFTDDKDTCILFIKRSINNFFKRVEDEPLLLKIAENMNSQSPGDIDQACQVIQKFILLKVELIYDVQTIFINCISKIDNLNRKLQLLKDQTQQLQLDTRLKKQNQDLLQEFKIIHKNIDKLNKDATVSNQLIDHILKAESINKLLKLQKDFKTTFKCDQKYDIKG